MTYWMDEARRQLGRGLDLLGLGPREMPHRTVAEFVGARLRAYHDRQTAEGPVLLIVAAPFKRCYIWDLLPEVSVVRRCLERGLRVYMLEWLLPTRAQDEFGLAEFADRLPGAALDAVRGESGSVRPILAGHSIGGTLAAIFASLYPDEAAGLLLVDAPLAFGEHGGPLAQAAKAIPDVRLVRAATGSPVAGSVINLLSLTAAPDAFHLQRMEDLAASLYDPRALRRHACAERWAHDEFPLPGRLFEELAELLYRDDRFMAGTLQVGARLAGIARLRAPTMAVVNTVGRVVPPRSILDGLEAAPGLSFEVLVYEGDRGVMLQHLGPLIAPVAHRRLWPKILDWAERIGGRAAGA